MKKKIKKLKFKITFMRDDIEHLQDQVNNLQKRQARKKDLSMKIMRIVITSSLVIISLASIYSLFFHIN